MAKNTNKQREAVIAAALSTPQSRSALAGAMASAINISVNYPHAHEGRGSHAPPIIDYQDLGGKLVKGKLLEWDGYPGARSAVSDYMQKWVENEAKTRKY